MDKKEGLALETHTVETEDGYFLNLFRVPEKAYLSNLNSTAINPNASVDDIKKGQNKGVVLFVSGIVSSGIEWFLNSPEKCLPLILATEGFDCWLLSYRGSHSGTGSRLHATLDINSNDYWDFGIEELAMYDVPAAMDYILKHTGSDNVFTIGHSLGCSVLFMNASLRPEYRSKVKAMIALTPPVYFKHLNNLAFHAVRPFLTLFGMSRVMYSREICGKSVLEMAKMIPFGNPLTLGAWFLKQFGLITGAIGYHQLEEDRLPLLASYTPAPTSMKVVCHANQMVFGSFCKYDYGRTRNEKLYGQGNPPAFSLSDITFPVATFSTIKDTFIPAKDVVRVAEELPNLIAHKEIQDRTFRHAEFMYGKDAHELVYKDIVEILNKRS